VSALLPRCARRVFRPSARAIARRRALDVATRASSRGDARQSPRGERFDGVEAEVIYSDVDATAALYGMQGGRSAGERNAARAGCAGGRSSPRIAPMSIRSLALAALLVASSLAPLVAQGQTNGTPPPPQMPAPPQQVPLTDETAKSAVDAYLEIREKYGDGETKPGTKAEAAARAAEMQAGVKSIVEKAGFASVPDWNKTMMSVVTAYGAVKGNTMAEVDAGLAEIESRNMPEPLKAQMRALMESRRPSPGNLEVVTKLADDPVYGPKLAQIRK